MDKWRKRITCILCIIIVVFVGTSTVWGDCKTRVLFIGANDSELIDRVLKYDNVYGIKEGILVDENVGLISKIHPNSNIVALTYEPLDESVKLKEFYDLEDKYKSNKFEHISVVDDGIELAKEKLAKLDENTVILELYSSGVHTMRLSKILKFKSLLMKMDIY